MVQTVRMSDAGEYSVVAGSSVSKAQLTVEGRDIRISEPAEREVTVRRILFLTKVQNFTVDSQCENADLVYPEFMVPDMKSLVAVIKL